MKKTQYKILQKLFNKNMEHPSATINIPLDIEENFKDSKSKEEIKYLIHTGYIEYSSHAGDIKLTKKGQSSYIEEKDKDWLTKATEWFKIRNIIGYIITTIISLISIALSIFNLIKRYSK